MTSDNGTTTSAGGIIDEMKETRQKYNEFLEELKGNLEEAIESYFQQIIPGSNLYKRIHSKRNKLTPRKGLYLRVLPYKPTNKQEHVMIKAVRSRRELELQKIHKKCDEVMSEYDFPTNWMVTLTLVRLEIAMVHSIIKQDIQMRLDTLSLENGRSTLDSFVLCEDNCEAADERFKEINQRMDQISTISSSFLTSNCFYRECVCDNPKYGYDPNEEREKKIDDEANDDLSQPDEETEDSSHSEAKKNYQKLFIKTCVVCKCRAYVRDHDAMYDQMIQYFLIKPLLTTGKVRLTEFVVRNLTDRDEALDQWGITFLETSTTQASVGFWIKDFIGHVSGVYEVCKEFKKRNMEKIWVKVERNRKPSRKQRRILEQATRFFERRLGYLSHDSDSSDDSDDSDYWYKEDNNMFLLLRRNLRWSKLDPQLGNGGYCGYVDPLLLSSNYYPHE